MVTQNGVPISSCRRYRLPMLPLSSQTIHGCIFLSVEWISCAVSTSACLLRRSGETIALIGAILADRERYVRFSPPSSSSRYALTNSARMVRSTPSDGGASAPSEAAPVLSHRNQIVGNRARDVRKVGRGGPHPLDHSGAVLSFCSALLCYAWLKPRN